MSGSFIIRIKNNLIFIRKKQFLNWGGALAPRCSAGVKLVFSERFEPVVRPRIEEGDPEVVPRATSDIRWTGEKQWPSKIDTV